MRVKVQTLAYNLAFIVFTARCPPAGTIFAPERGLSSPPVLSHWASRAVAALSFRWRCSSTWSTSCRRSRSRSRPPRSFATTSAGATALRASTTSSARWSRLLGHAVATTVNFPGQICPDPSMSNADPGFLFLVVVPDRRLSLIFTGSGRR